MARFLPTLATTALATFIGKVIAFSLAGAFGTTIASAILSALEGHIQTALWIGLGALVVLAIVAELIRELRQERESRISRVVFVQMPPGWEPEPPMWLNESHNLGSNVPIESDDIFEDMRRSASYDLKAGAPPSKSNLGN
ncbi:hypothetical protein AAGW05_00050 [Arthrobacter sp. LAPM80]|uniref:hypothetical protein n=1 Tax=Arthrobacter sp. LAPM80 TaxID=3141788 RepID=UPI00398A8AA8